jgi:hypothetical protein
MLHAFQGRARQRIGTVVRDAYKPSGAHFFLTLHASFMIKIPSMSVEDAIP